MSNSQRIQGQHDTVASVCTETLIFKSWHQETTGSISSTRTKGCLWEWTPSMHTHHTHASRPTCACVRDLRSPTGPLRSGSSRGLGQRGRATGAEGQARLERPSQRRRRSSAALCSDSLVQMAAVWFSRNGKQLRAALSPPRLTGTHHGRVGICMRGIIWPTNSGPARIPNLTSPFSQRTEIVL